MMAGYMLVKRIQELKKYTPLPVRFLTAFVYLYIYGKEKEEIIIKLTLSNEPDIDREQTCLKSTSTVDS